MATVLTSLNPTQRPTTYAGAASIRREDSAIPVDEIEFSSKFSQVATPGAGNNQGLAIACAPPRNFAYVLSQIFLELRTSGASTNNWPNVITGTLGNSSVTAQTDFLVPFELVSNGAGLLQSDAGAESKVYCPSRAPGQVIVPRLPGATAYLSIQSYNSTANDVAYLVNFYARFLMFTIDQVRNYQVSYPTPVRVA